MISFNIFYFASLLVFILVFSSGCWPFSFADQSLCSLSDTSSQYQKVKDTKLIISGRILNVYDKSSVVLVLKILKGFNIIGNVKKASQTNDYHLILIENIDIMYQCQLTPRPNQDFILFLKTTSKPNVFLISYFDKFNDGSLEKRILKLINGGFSKQVQSDDPCTKLNCKFGATCKIWPGKNIKAVCHCPTSNCANRRITNKICGSDGNLYESNCHLKLQQCLIQKQITQSPMYFCDSSYNKVISEIQQNIQQDGSSSQYSCEQQSCPPYAVCVPYPHPHCKCPTDKCTSNSPSVCGTDEITYTNVCEMKKVSCKANRLINQQYVGRCDLCKFINCEFNGVCKMNEDGSGTQCECPDPSTACIGQNNVAVCASDGLTYRSECHMNAESCRKKTQLTVFYKGICKTKSRKRNNDVCANQECFYGAKCTATKQQDSRSSSTNCSCNHINCYNEWPELICGDDGKTYDNRCMLKKKKCELQRQISILHQGKCTDQNPCNRVKCPSRHQFCRVDVNGRGKCVCPDSCPAIVQPVCGSDNKTYESICHLIRYACINNKSIWAVHNGICSEEPRCQEQGFHCSTYQICRSNLADTKCECPSCPENGVGEHVCGSDGNTYRSECHFRQEVCSKNKHSVSLAHLGACDACRQTKCSFYAICKTNRFGEPHCICPTDCIYLPNPVCGSDGRTYKNECFLKVKSCAENKLIKIIAKGHCKRCPNDCPLGQMCRNGRCVCAEKCSKVKLKVCGTDGNFYQNECELKRQECLQRRTIHIDFTEVNCISRRLISDENQRSQYQYSADNKRWDNARTYCQCNKIGALSSFCDPSTNQCQCKNGVAGKLCDRCAVGYWKFSKNGCTACSCSKFGSESIQCNVNDGRCKCKGNAMGRYCSVCPPGFEMSNNGCKDLQQNLKTLDQNELGFMKDSYATSYWTGNADRYLLINMTLLPYSRDGIIFFVADPTYSADYLSIILKDSYVELRIDLGSGMLLLKSRERLSQGKTHTIIAERFERYARLAIDDSDSVHGKNPKFLKSLDTGSRFTIGQPQGLASNTLDHTGGITDGFLGCFKSLTIKASYDVTNYLMKTQKSWIVESSNVKPNCPRQNYIDESNLFNRNVYGSNNNNNYAPKSASQNYCSLNHPCKNDGICKDISPGVYNCLCQPGYQGHSCEDYVAPIWKFTRQSFVIIPTGTLQLRRRFKLELQFLPTKGNGLLSFISDGHKVNPAFISVALSNNYVEAICRTPIGVTKIRSKETVKIGKWNHLIVLKAAKYVYLNLNQSPNPRKQRLIPKHLMQLSDNVRRKLTQFRITNQPLFIGGVDEGNYKKFASVVNLRPNHEGAIQKIIINGEIVKFKNSDLFFNNITQWQGSPCGPLYNPCRKNNPQKNYCIPDMNKHICFCNPEQEHLCLSDYMQRDYPSTTNYNRKFAGKSVVKYTSTKNKRVKYSEKNNIRLTFKTSATDGMLLFMKKKYNVRKHFFVVALRNSVIEVAINLGGNRGIIRITSNRKVSDQSWHTVQVIRNKRNVVLLVDNRMFRAQMLNDPLHSSLHTDGWIWLGGSKKRINGFPWEYNKKFEGCVSEMYVDEVAYNLISDSRKNFGPVLKC